VKKRKIKAITAFKVIQGHRGRYQLKARIRFLLVINSNWHLVPFRSYRSSLFKFRTLCVFEPPFGGLGTTYDVHLGLIGKDVGDLIPISVNWTFFARCYGWVATSEKRSRTSDFAPTRSVSSKISGRRGSPPSITLAR